MKSWFLKILVLKVADSCHNHGNTVFVAVFNGVVISDASAWLNNRIDAFFAGNLNAIGKWEECIGSHHGTLQVELEIMSLFDGLLKGVNARGLTDATGNKLLVFSQNYSVAFAVLNNLVCKQEVVDLSRCDSFVGGLFEFGRHFNVIVALLNKGAVQACAHLHVGTIEWLDYQNYAVLFLL